MWIIILLLSVISTNAYSSGWTTADKVREGVYLTVAAVDYMQTLDIKTHISVREANPILGRTPSDVGITSYFIVASILHVLISDALPPKYRTLWQYSTIVINTATINNNARIGLEIKF